MHVWEISIQNIEWEANPFQSIMVLTEAPDIVEAISIASGNVPSATINAVKYIGSAYK